MSSITAREREPGAYRLPHSSVHSANASSCAIATHFHVCLHAHDPQLTRSLCPLMLCVSCWGLPNKVMQNGLTDTYVNACTHKTQGP